MITVDNIIDFYNAMNHHLTEEQIYELLKFMKEHIHHFNLQVTYFYCTILKEEYFDITSKLCHISHGGDEELKQFAHDIYQYCLIKFNDNN